MCCALHINVSSKATAQPYTLPDIIICGMQCAVKKLLLVKVEQQTLQGVQTEDLQTAYSYLVGWSAITELYYRIQGSLHLQ